MRFPESPLRTTAGICNEELQLQRHLQEAIEITSRGVSFVVSSGTGSGQSIGLLMSIGTGQDSRDQKLVDEVQDMELLLLDALHTYRGRRGAGLARPARGA
jgi:ATP-dependent helicase YprA (DUF1998 family)